jgi:hypothetical protein
VRSYVLHQSNLIVVDFEESLLRIMYKSNADVLSSIERHYTLQGVSFRFFKEQRYDRSEYDVTDVKKYKECS